MADSHSIPQPGFDRFWAKVVKLDECWEFRHSIATNGYGRFWDGGKNCQAHRVSWVMAHGEIPNGLLVCHRCDNRLCVRPDHLFLGTQLDNIRDMDAKGRGVRVNFNPATGEAHGSAKLTAHQVSEIRHAHEHGARQADLARLYGVHTSTMSGIIRRKNWK